MEDRRRNRQMYNTSSGGMFHIPMWRQVALVAWVAILSSSTLPVVASISADKTFDKPFDRISTSLRSQKYSARHAGQPRDMLIGTNPESMQQVVRPPRALSSVNTQKQRTRTLKVTKSSSEEEEASLGISGVGKGKGTKSTKQPTTPAPTKASSTKSSKSKGKGKGSDNIFDNDDDPTTDDSTDYDDDDGTPHYSPTRAPVTNPSPTRSPVTSPTTSPVSTPTQVPTSSPTNSEPTTGREPTTNPPVQLEPTAAPVAECPIGSDGSFGSQVGLTEEVTFVYQAEVIPSVTVSEMNLEILNNVETLMGEIALEDLFDQCAATSSSSTSTSSTRERKKFFGGRSRQLRTLQTTQDLTGFSIRPRDTVIEDVECVNVEQVFPCHVIQGRVTAYSDQAIDDDTLDDVFAAIQAAIENGSLESSDSRILGVTWRDLTVDPLPGTDDDNVQDDDTTNDDDNTDDGGINDDDTTAKTPAPTSSPVNNPTNPVIKGDDDGLELWAYVLIGVGSVLVCCTAYLCLRPPARPPVLDDYDDGEPSDSSDDNFEDEIEPKERIPLVAPPVYEPPPNRNATAARSAPTAKATPPQNKQTQDAYVVGSTAAPTPIQEVDESSKSSSKSKSQSSRSRSSRSRSSRSSGSPIERQSTKGSQSSLIRDDTQELKDNNGWTASAVPRGEKMPQESGHTLELDNKSGEPSVLSFQMESSGEVELEVEESNSDSKWDENEFTKNAAPPMESTSEEFSSEYSEEEVVEEYEIEYVEEGEASEAEEESGSYSDEFSDEDDEGEITYYDDDNIVRDEPGKSPILPWLAQDDQ